MQWSTGDRRRGHTIAHMRACDRFLSRVQRPGPRRDCREQSEAQNLVANRCRPDGMRSPRFEKQSRAPKRLDGRRCRLRNVARFEAVL